VDGTKLLTNQAGYPNGRADGFETKTKYFIPLEKQDHMEVDEKEQEVWSVWDPR
jgi:hypothetical protein